MQKQNESVLMNAVVMGFNPFNVNQIVIPENQALNIGMTFKAQAQLSIQFRRVDPTN